jgi:PST family polysaccharide transporter
MIQTYQSIFQSKGEYRFSLMAAVIGFLVKLFSNYPMTAQFGTIGSSLSTILALLVVYILMLIHGREYLLGTRFVGKMMLCLFSMSLVIFPLRFILPTDTSRLWTLLFSILVSLLGMIVFFAMLLVSKALSEEELKRVPILNKLRK